MFLRFIFLQKSQKWYWCHWHICGWAKLSVPGFWNSWNESMVNHVFSLDERKEEVSELDKQFYCALKWCHMTAHIKAEGGVWLPSSPKAQSTLEHEDMLWKLLSRLPITRYQKTLPLKAENYHSTEMISSPDMNGHPVFYAKPSL